MIFPSGPRSFYLEEIGEPRDNDLRVVVIEAVLGEPEETEIGLARPHHPIGRAFELYWANYVAYAVRNESFARREDGEAPSQDRLHRREKSAFLDFVTASTIATSDYPGPLTHWALLCESHCVDVIAVDPPGVRLLGEKDSR